MKILLVDDDPDVTAAVRMTFELGWHGIDILEAGTGEAALTLVEEERPDLVLLDVGLPDTDGYTVLRDIRRFSDVAVLMVTARDQPIDKVRGLELGADDYIAKPFDHLELLARSRAVLRRADVKAPGHRLGGVRSGQLEIDLAAREARLAGRRLHLTPTEWRVLATLARNPGWVVTSEQLGSRVWGRDHDASTGDLRVFVRRLRAKLDDDAGRPRHIETVRGVGYRLLSD